MAGKSPFGYAPYWLDKAKKALAEADRHLATAQEIVRGNEKAMLEITRTWEAHPEGWENPCECATCRSYADS